MVLLTPATGSWTERQVTSKNLFAKSVRSNNCSSVPRDQDCEKVVITLWDFHKDNGLSSVGGSPWQPIFFHLSSLYVVKKQFCVIHSFIHRKGAKCRNREGR